jgi:hypothetical protein
VALLEGQNQQREPGTWTMIRLARISSVSGAARRIGNERDGLGRHGRSVAEAFGLSARPGFGMAISGIERIVTHGAR